MPMTPATNYAGSGRVDWSAILQREELDHLQRMKRQDARQMRSYRMGQYGNIASAVFGVRQMMAIAPYEDRAASAQLAASIAGLDAQTVGIGASASAAGSAARTAEVGLRAGLEVVAAQRRRLDERVERQQRVLGGAVRALERESEFRARLHVVEGQEAQRETRRRIGTLLAEQAARGGRGSAAFVGSIAERERERVEMEVRNLRQAAMQAGMEARREELAAGEETLAEQQEVERERLEQQETQLRRQAIETYSGAMAGLARAGAQRTAVQAQRKAVRSAYALARKQRSQARRGALFGAATQIGSSVMGLRGLG